MSDQEALDLTIQEDGVPIKCYTVAEDDFWNMDWDGMAMNGQEAKDRVWAHWEDLRRLCERQFPGDANLGEGALNYVLEKLQANDWSRVREWEEQNRFKTFLTVITERLLTDFRRQRFGYQRPPKWLKEQNDPIWQRAYRLLYRDKYSRQEAIEKLLTQEPNPERRHIEEIVMMTLARCPAPIVSPDAQKQPLDEWHHVESEQSGPLVECLNEEERMREEWARSLLDDGITHVSRLTHEQLHRFRQSIHLTEEDRILLRLRFAEGLAVPAIAKMLGLKGDPYKRLGRLLNELEKAFRQLKFYEAGESL